MEKSKGVKKKSGKKTTVNFTDADLRIIRRLAAKAGGSMTDVLRRALRLEDMVQRA